VSGLLLPPLAAPSQVRRRLVWPESSGPAPSWATRRSPDRPTYGPVVAAIAAELGMPLMPWQRYIVDVIHEVDADGFWVYDEIVITVPRQAGKTTLKIPIYVHRLGNLRLGSLWMTAQSGGKALERWNAARNWMELPGSPLAGMIKSKVSIGHEEILWLATRARLVPFTPNEEEMHGETPDLVDIDEWWAFDWQKTTELEQAYSPGFLTKNAQAIKTSTAGTSKSFGLNRDVARGRQAVELDRRSGLAYFEWSLPDLVNGVPVEDLSDEDLIEACIAIHPAIGFHPRMPAPRMVAHIRSKEWELLGRDGFLRAYGNRAQHVGALSIIPGPAWAAAMGDSPIPRGVLVGLGAGIDPKHGDSAIAAAWRDLETGHVTVEVIRYHPGTDWLVGSFVALAHKWDHVQLALNNAGPTLEAADAIERHPDFDQSWKPGKADGTKGVLRMTAQAYAAGCERIVKEATATPRPTFHHIGQAELTLGQETAKKRRVGTGGGWAWDAGDNSIAPLEAVTAAVWAIDHPRETVPELPRFKVR
jgi:hypothetical protein